MTRLLNLVRERVEREGSLSFSEYMSLALYHPEFGYYSAGPARTGWRGHYLTAPELDPAFGALWARGFEQVWESSRKPDEFVLWEIGAGEGGFAAAVLDAVAGDFAAALDYRIVEPIPALESRQRARLPEGPAWYSSLGEAPASPCSCVFANEVVDNLPVDLIERRGEKLVELRVGLSGGSLSWLTAPAGAAITEAIEALGVDLPDGFRFEVPRESDAFVRAAAGTIEKGAVVLVDYGDEATGLATRPGGTLVCYSAAGVDDEPLDLPGHKDITAYANWTLLRRALESCGLEVLGPRPQTDVLDGLGLRERAAALKSAHDAAAAAGRGAEAVRMLSGRAALGALADPGGLGRLGVLVGLKDVATPPFLD